MMPATELTIVAGKPNTKRYNQNAAWWRDANPRVVKPRDIPKPIRDRKLHDQIHLLYTTKKGEGLVYDFRHSYGSARNAANALQGVGHRMGKPVYTRIRCIGTKKETPRIYLYVFRRREMTSARKGKETR